MGGRLLRRLSGRRLGRGGGCDSGGERSGGGRRLELRGEDGHGWAVDLGDVGPAVAETGVRSVCTVGQLWDKKYHSHLVPAAAVDPNVEVPAGLSTDAAAAAAAAAVSGVSCCPWYRAAAAAVAACADLSMVAALCPDGVRGRNGERELGAETPVAPSRGGWMGP